MTFAEILKLNKKETAEIHGVIVEFPIKTLRKNITVISSQGTTEYKNVEWIPRRGARTYRLVGENVYFTFPSDSTIREEFEEVEVMQEGLIDPAHYDPEKHTFQGFMKIKQ